MDRRFLTFTPKLIGKLIIAGALLLPAILGTTGCSGPELEYWWTRGQPPSAKKLVSRSKDALAVAKSRDMFKRGDMVSAADDVENSLMSALRVLDGKSKGENFPAALIKAQDSFMKLEGKLSYGSRPAYGELSEQLRHFAQRATGGEHVHSSAFALFTSRTLFFLANELEVPPVATQRPRAAS